MSHLTNWKCSECGSPVKYSGRSGDNFTGVCAGYDCNAVNYMPVDSELKQGFSIREIVRISRSIDPTATVTVTRDDVVTRCRSCYAEAIRDAVENELGATSVGSWVGPFVEMSFNWNIDFTGKPSVGTPTGRLALEDNRQYTGEMCPAVNKGAVCGLAQFTTPGSGVVCSEGHGF